MKTTQILLYSIIRNKFIEDNILDVNFHQISANRKSKGATKGNEGYKERKNITIERLKSAHEKEEYVFENNTFENWKNTSKKDDMADAFCMCVDFYNKTK
jgi:predicted RNase H-like nuclease